MKILFYLAFILQPCQRFGLFQPHPVSTGVNRGFLHQSLARKCCAGNQQPGRYACILTLDFIYKPRIFFPLFSSSICSIPISLQNHLKMRSSFAALVVVALGFATATPVQPLVGKSLIERAVPVTPIPGWNYAGCYGEASTGKALKAKSVFSMYLLPPGYLPKEYLY